MGAIREGVVAYGQLRAECGPAVPLLPPLSCRHDTPFGYADCDVPNENVLELQPKL